MNEEQQIIEYGTKAGKSQQEIQSAITRYRATTGKVASPPPVDISLGEKVGKFLAPTATESIKKFSRGEKITGREALGSALEIGSFLVPAGAVARGAGLAAKGVGLAARGLGTRALQAGAVGAVSGGMAGAGREVGAGGTLGEIAGATAGGAALGGVAGAVLPIAGAIPRAVSKGAKAIAEKAVPKLLSYTSDVPEKAFETMLQRREPVVSAIKAGATPQTALKRTQEAVRGLRKTLTNDWQEGIKSIADEFVDNRLGLSDKSASSLLKIADEFGFEDKIPQNLKSASVKEWMDTLKAMNELPRGILTMSPKGVKVRALQDELKKSVIKTFGGEKGSVAQLYKNYSAKKGIFDAANDIVNAYSTGKPIQQSTALNRLQTLFNENKPAYLEAILDLEKITGRDILSEITASKFANKLPTMGTSVSATSGIMSPAGPLDKAIKLMILPLSSPRSAGFIARTLGKVKSPGMPKGISPGDRVFPTLQKGASNINKTMAGKGGLSMKDVSKSPLLTEARKYKTAEEFVDNVGGIRDNYDWSYLDEMKARKKAGESYSHSDFAYLSKIEAIKRGKESRTFYRAGTIEKDGDVWLTPQEAGATQYGSSGGTKVGEYKVATKNPLILQDIKSIEKVLGKKLANESNFTNSPLQKQAVIDYAKKNGYDSVLMPDSFPDGAAGMESLVVWDKNLVKTRSQLTDIWKEAHKK